MDIEELYKLKLAETTNINTLSLVDLFKSEINLNILTNQLYKNNYLPNNSELYNKIKESTNKYINAWITLGKFDNVEIDNNNNDNRIYILLRYYNKLFIDTFSIYITGNNYLEHEIANNPYHHKYNINNTIKTMDEFQADDYQYINGTNNNDKFTLNTHFTKAYNQIPYYEKCLYNKHYDRQDMGSLTNRSLEKSNSKKYDNTELLNNIDYLKKNNY